ncbi:MAG: DUF1491 family protein [Pseudomonadota bacterium]
MRLTSEIWIQSLMRRVFADGQFAAVLRQGSPDAGAIFIRVRQRDGSETLLAPAPQSHFGDSETPERSFEPRNDLSDASEIDALLESEKRFDPDLWVVEIETEEPEHYVSVMPA